MNKFFSILLIVFAVPAHATTMCAANDTVAIILDPSIDGIDSGGDFLTSTWWIKFQYGTLQGQYACVNKDETPIGGERSGGYCWIKMTHPVSSAWVKVTLYGGGAGECNSYCINSKDRVKTNKDLREKLFGSITN